MKAALVGADGTLLHEARRRTGRERGAEAVIESILGFAAELRAHGEQHFGRPAEAAGVAIPGIIDSERGIALFAANLGWKEIKLPKPVFAGDTLYAESTVLDKRESGSRPNEGIVTIRTLGRNQHGEVVCEFERTFLVMKRGHPLGSY